MANLHFLDTFFFPSSVAIVGASRNPLSINYRLVENLVRLGFKGRVFPVNPGADEIEGLKAYANLKDIAGHVDLVVSAVPASMTMNIMKQCIDKKVCNVVIVSGGFSEAGENGKKEQDNIANLLKENGIRAIGPNALSPINSSNNLLISFLPTERIISGNISLIFQSGFYDPRLNWIFSDFHLGVNKIIDLGNKMDINEVDALEYLAADESTKAVAIHVETLRGDGKRFFQLLKATSKVKPVIVFKSGRTIAGAKAVASHTGAMARENDVIFDSLIRQAGAIRAHTVEDFFDLAKAFSFFQPPLGNRIVLGSLSGGEGVIAIDAALKSGFSIATPEVNNQNGVEIIFPPWEISLNPFDLGVCSQFHGWDKAYDIFFASMADDASVDCIVVGLPPLGLMYKPEEACKPFIKAKDKGKAVVVWRPAMHESLETLILSLEANHIPVYPSAERAISSLAIVYRYYSWHGHSG